MAFWGDLCMQDRTTMFCGFPYANTDMTAIVRLYIPEGFVIAADGLRVHSENPALNLSDAQKIVRIDGSGRRLACACTGVAQISPDDSEGIVFDFLTQANTVAKQLHYRRYKNLRQYTLALAHEINGRLSDVKSSGKIAKYPSCTRLPMDTADLIAALYIDGFYDGVPSRNEVHFRHNDQELLEPAVVDQPIENGNAIIQGPHTPGFTVLQRSTIGTIEEAVESARAYIRSCSDPESIAIDPEACAMIGGHVHIATITRQTDFHWAVPPVTEQY